MLVQYSSNCVPMFANIRYNKRLDRFTLRGGSSSAWCTTSRSARITAIRSELKRMGRHVWVTTSHERVASGENHDPLENHFLQAAQCMSAEGLLLRPQCSSPARGPSGPSACNELLCLTANVLLLSNTRRSFRRRGLLVRVLLELFESD
jgi:hypothetical protein